jgi:dipeptidyl aminopeptidase/acylaminoacyl peptidase
VLSVNYRGSTGFGKAFVNAANLEWAGKMHDDLIDAVDWAIARQIADPAHLAIMGGSYGGYAALVGLTFTPEKFACAIDLVGISNLVTFLNTIPEYWMTWKLRWKVPVGDYTTEAGLRFLEERSPLNRADQIVRPLLIGQGANDVRVKASESEQIVAAMQQHGIPVTYVYYRDEGHGLGRPRKPPFVYGRCGSIPGGSSRRTLRAGWQRLRELHNRVQDWPRTDPRTGLSSCHAVGAMLGTGSSALDAVAPG